MLNLIPGVYQVPQSHAVIIERFGKYEKTLLPGFNFVNPLLYTCKSFSDWQGTASKCNYLMELTEQQLKTNSRRCQTKDNVTIDADTVIYFKISDPVKAVYSVDVLPAAIQDMCLNVLRSKVGAYDFDDIFSHRAEISQKVTTELEQKVTSWGIELRGVEIGKLEYDKEIYIALQKKRIAEAEKDAEITSAESKALTAIKEAETQLKKREIEIQIKRTETQAEAEMLEIQAIGRARALEIESLADSKAHSITKQMENKFIEDLATKVGKDGAIQLTVASKAVDGFEALSNNPTHKVIVLPNDFKGIVKLVGVEK